MKKAFALALVSLVCCCMDAFCQWTPLPETFSQVQFLDDSNGYAIRVYPDLGQYPLFVTSDAGNTWHERDSSFFLSYKNNVVAENIPTAFHFLTRSQGVAFCLTGGARQNLEETLDSGATWHVVDPGVELIESDPNRVSPDLRFMAEVGAKKIVFASAAHLHHGAGLLVYRSQPQGKLPYDRVLDGRTVSGYSICDIRSYAEDGKGTAIAILQDTGARSIIVRRLASDTSWRILNVLSISNNFFSDAKEIKYVGGVRWGAATDSGVYSSNDNGSHWTLSLPSQIPTTHLSFGSGGRGYATQQSVRYVLASEDSGKSWHREALPLLSADSLQLPALGGSRTSVVCGTINGWPNAAWINHSASPQRSGGLYLPVRDTSLGILPKNDSIIHRLLVRNDDTSSWMILNVTGNNPHFRALDSNLTVPAGDSVYVRYVFAVTTSRGEGVQVILRTNDALTSPLLGYIDARAKLPHLRITKDTEIANLQLGDTLVKRTYLENDGTDTLRIVGYRASSNLCTIVGGAPLQLSPYEQLPFDISIHPLRPGADSGFVIIESNAESAPFDTIPFYVFAANDRVNSSWSLIRPTPKDTSDAFAQTMMLSNDGKLLVGIQAADLTARQAMILDECDSSGKLQWSRSIQGNGAGPDIPHQITTDDAQNIYFSGFLRGQFDCILASFDKFGGFRWADTVGHDSGAAPNTTLVLPHDQVVQISHGYAWSVAGLTARMEEGQIGVLTTDRQNSRPRQTLINGFSSLFLDAGNTGSQFNLDDYPVTAISDGADGFYLLSNMDVTDTSVWYQTFFNDKRAYELTHFSTGQATPSWMKRVEGGSFYVASNHNAVVIGDSITELDTNGNVVRRQYQPIGNSWVRSSNGEIHSYAKNLGTTSYSENKGLLWKQHYNGLLVDPYSHTYPNLLPSKLLTDASSNVYVICTVPAGKGTAIVISKYDSIGIPRWIISHKGTARDTAIDAVLDPHGPIYVCGGSADSNDHYRPLIWKIEQDPIPGAVEQPKFSVLEELGVYPNPFSQTATVTVPTSIATPFDYELIDPLGRRVAGSAGAQNRSITLSGRGLATGVYIMRVRDLGGNVVEKKLLLQR